MGPYKGRAKRQAAIAAAHAASTIAIFADMLSRKSRQTAERLGTRLNQKQALPSASEPPPLPAKLHGSHLARPIRHGSAHICGVIHAEGA
ncbi:hypothetical protein BHK69_07110 [Bosea vaviloviae]|uniref:Uncharacterized protein n=1 Tax=Bosea vaviloviae TaxID=1526658 RepID=A0A1D7TYS4_9HYPH|nr:hypothetical protein BHK69_07110 [Bosea vaviloviae]